MSARLERFFVRAFGLILLLKAIDLVVRLLPLEGPLLTGILVGPWVLASSLLVCRRFETFACLVIVAIVAAALLIVGQPIHNQHLYLIVSIATILAIFRGPERKIALRAQLSIMYGFAALAKLNAGYLAGGTIEATFPNRVFWNQILEGPPLSAAAVVALAYGSVATEAWLAVGLWFRKTRYVTALVGVGFQVALVVLFSNGLIHFLRLGVFALLTLLLYLAFFSEDEVFGSGGGWNSEQRLPSKARAPT